MKKPILLFTALAALGTAAQAGTYVTQQQYTQEVTRTFESISLYNAGELQLDLFGAYVFRDDGDSRLFSDDVAGGGVGVNYFFTRGFGLGLEGMVFDTDGDTLGSTAANLFLRKPFGESGFALYAFAGAGIVFNADHLDEEDFERARDRLDDDREPSDADDIIFEAHAGLGLEYRFSENFGIFTDGRRTFVDRDDSDYTSGRVGVRIVF